MNKKFLDSLKLDLTIGNIKLDYILYAILLVIANLLFNPVSALLIGFLGILLIKPEIKKLTITDSLNITFISLISILCIILFSIWSISAVYDPLFELYKANQKELEYSKALYILLVLSPISEEFIYRGFCLKLFKKANLGVTTSIILSSLLFALSHGTILHLIPAFLIGLVFCLVVEITGNIYITIILHTIYNLLALIIFVNTPIYMAYIYVLIVCCLIYLLYHMKNYLQKRL